MRKTDRLIVWLLVLFSAILPARADAIGGPYIYMVYFGPWLVVALAVLAIVLIIRHIRNNNKKD